MSTALATYMQSRGISDADIAALTGRDRSMINKIKRGMLRPTLELAGRIETATAGEVRMQSWLRKNEPCSRCGASVGTANVEACESGHCPQRAQAAA